MKLAATLGLLAVFAVSVLLLTAANRGGASELRAVDSVACRNDSLLVEVGGEVRYVPQEWTLCEYGPNRTVNKHKKRPRR